MTFVAGVLASKDAWVSARGCSEHKWKKKYNFSASSK